MRLYNEINVDTTSRVKYYLGKVVSVDENYVVTFKIPKILENLSAYPTAYPRESSHVKEVKVDDTILVEQLDTTTQFFTYTVVNENNNTGLYFGDVSVDITDGKVVNIDTKKLKVTVDGEQGTIFIGDKSANGYSFNQFIKDLDKALGSLHTEGNEYSQTAGPWFAQTLRGPLTKLEQIFK